MERVYDYPEYYEIAFSFRDTKAEVDTLEELGRRYSAIEVTRVFEVACGSAPHLPELVRRDYVYTGIDLNETMLAAAARRARPLRPQPELLRANLVDFTLPAAVDLAFVLVGSLYVTSAAELRSHFDAVARALRPGGLYVLDWCVDFLPAVDLADTWVQERNGIRVRTTYISTNVDRVQQTYRETVTLEVDDHGRHATLVETATKRAIYPQEFLLFIASRPDFEFVGWWNNWDLGQPLEDVSLITRPITVVRRI